MTYVSRFQSFCGTLIPLIIATSVISLTAVSTHSLNTPLFVASIGASATIVFVIPSSPMGKMWSLVAGYLVASMIGVGLSLFIHSIAVLMTASVTLTVIAMLLFKCMHPPGVATSMVPALCLQVENPVDFSFVIDPVLINVVPLAICGALFRLWLARSNTEKKENTLPDTPFSARNKKSVYFDELHQVVETRNEWLDIDEETLDQIFKETHLLALEHKNDKLTCEQVMTRDPLTLREHDSVYDGLKLLQQNHFSSIPVINDQQEIIGIFSLVDFLLYVEQRKINSFVGLYLLAKKRTSKTVGAYMKRDPIAIYSQEHVARLIPYLTSGFHHIPIINSENKLVGMVAQSDLIDFLYNLNA